MTYPHIAFVAIFYPLCLLSACHNQLATTQSVAPAGSNDHRIFPNTPETQQTPIITTQKPVPDAYAAWLNHHPNRQQATAYRSFLQRHGVTQLPNHELFRSARDWKKCAASAFEIPPVEIWPNIVPTLQIIKVLINDTIITDFTVTSVYRNARLNRCASGADSSRHVLNAAIDFRIDGVSTDAEAAAHIALTKKRLCEFWQKKGAALNMGLGVYRSGQIHIDSAGYRTWGFDHHRSSSPCLLSSH